MSAVLELALMECTAQVIGNIHNLPVEPRDVSRFVELFRPDFDKALHEPGSTPADVWLRDRAQVTTLARSIASFAEFLAILDDAKPGQVSYDHLLRSYRVLGPYCADDTRGSSRRQYCTNVRSTLGRLDDRRS